MQEWHQNNKFIFYTKSYWVKEYQTLISPALIFLIISLGFYLSTVQPIDKAVPKT